MLKLRNYQQDAINSLYKWLKENAGNPCVVAPTGSGKALLIAEMIRLCVQKWKGRVLVLAHVKELLEQEGEKLETYLPEIRFTYYSAGIGEKDFNSDVVIAGIQSIYRRAEEAGKFDLILVDECHLIPDDGEGMYRTFLSEARKVNPRVRLIGFTATPFRTGSGSIIGDDKLLNDIAYDIPVKRLIQEGYLSPLKMKGSKVKIDTSGLHIRAGEFIASEVDDLITDETISSACSDIIQRTQDRRSVLIFASSIRHAEMVRSEIERLSGQRCEIVTGDTPVALRDKINAEFRGVTDLFGNKTYPLKFLANVNVLTTGFDAPGIDCVVLLRPTASPVLYLQMIGRGLRIAEGKKDCLILDYGENVMRHGPIDNVTVAKRKSTQPGKCPQKECPKCHEIVLAGYAVCPECGFRFPTKEERRLQENAIKLAREAGDGILFKDEEIVKEYDVIDVTYSVYHNRKWREGDPETVKCEYWFSDIGSVSEWVSPENPKSHFFFKRWWEKRSNDPLPMTAAETVYCATERAFARPLRIRVTEKGGDKFPRVNVLKFGPIEKREKPKNLGHVCQNCTGYGLYKECGYCFRHDKFTDADDPACKNDFVYREDVLAELPF